MLQVAFTPVHQQGSSLTQHCLLSSVALKQSSDVVRGKEGPAVQTSPNSGNESIHRVIVDSGTMPERSIRVTHNMPAVGHLQASHKSNLCPYVFIMVRLCVCVLEVLFQSIICRHGLAAKPSAILLRTHNKRWP